MNNAAQSKGSTRSRLDYSFFALSYLSLFNLLLTCLSFTSWFSGTANATGAADRLFEHLRISGWRLDFAWLLFSNFLSFFSLLFCLTEIKRRSAKLAAVLVAAELVTFTFFVRHSLTSGLLYMG